MVYHDLAQVMIYLSKGSMLDNLRDINGTTSWKRFPRIPITQVKLKWHKETGSSGLFFYSYHFCGCVRCQDTRRKIHHHIPGMQIPVLLSGQKASLSSLIFLTKSDVLMLWAWILNRESPIINNQHQWEYHYHHLYRGKANNLHCFFKATIRFWCWLPALGLKYQIPRLRSMLKCGICACKWHVYYNIK